MKIFKLFIFFCVIHASLFVRAHQFLSFDTLFPVFWYEKAVQSTMRALHLIRSLRDKNDGVLQEAQFIMALGHMSFAHFCIKRIDDADVRIDDLKYYVRLIDQCSTFLSTIQMTMHNAQSMNDQIDCLLYIMNSIQNQLQIKTNI